MLFLLLREVRDGSHVSHPAWVRSGSCVYEPWRTLDNAACRLSHTLHLQNCYHVIQSYIGRDFRAFFKEFMERDVADLILRSCDMYSYLWSEWSFLALEKLYQQNIPWGLATQLMCSAEPTGPRWAQDLLSLMKGLLPHSCVSTFARPSIIWWGVNPTQHPWGRPTPQAARHPRLQCAPPCSVDGAAGAAAIPTVCNVWPKAAAGITAPDTGAKLAWGIANSGSLPEVRNLFLTFWYFSRFRCTERYPSTQAWLCLIGCRKGTGEWVPVR